MACRVLAAAGKPYPAGGRRLARRSVARCV